MLVNGMHNFGNSFKNLAGQPSGPEEEEFFHARRAVRISSDMNIDVSILVLVRRANSGAKESFMVNMLPKNVLNCSAL